MEEGLGDRHRQEFTERMQQIAPGAVLAKGKYHWTVERSEHYATTTRLHLRCGRRTTSIDVMICHAGPHLGPELRCVALPPTQKRLFA